MQEQIQAVRAKVDEVVALAETKFGKMPHISVSFNLRGKCAGQARWRNNFFSGVENLELRFNREHIAMGGTTYKHIVDDVVAHEVAHIVCVVFPHLGKNHNPGWKRVCRELGGNGERCYSNEDAPEAVAKQSPYIYTTSNNYEVRVSARCHTKVQRGSSYRYKGGKGSINRDSAYRYEPNVVELKTPGNNVAVKPAIKPAPITPLVITPRKHTPVKRTAGKVSNADLIRAQIRAGKSKEECIAYGVNELGMKPALARTYVKNNWSKA